MLASMPQESPPEISHEPLQLPPLHFGSVHRSVCNEKIRWRTDSAANLAPSRSRGQAYAEHRTAAIGALGTDLTAEGIDQLPHDVKSETGTAVLP